MASERRLILHPDKLPGPGIPAETVHDGSDSKSA